MPTLTERIATDTDASSIASSSNTPVSGNAYTVAVSNRIDAESPNTPTLSGTNGWGVTWTQRGTQVGVSDDIRITLFDGVPNSGVAGVLTADFGGQTQTALGLEIVEWPDADASAIQGQTPVAATANSTTVTATLSAFGNSDNTAYLPMLIRANTTIVPDTGWTELGAEVRVPGFSVGSIYRVGDGDLTPSATIGFDAIWTCIA
ncbi:hypothetical protein LCGC14_2735400, partial [marine sediment metagenome]